MNVIYNQPISATYYLQDMQSGTAPNVIRVTSDSAGAVFAKGYLLNLSQYLAPSYFRQFLPLAMQDWNLSGSVYGLPDNLNYVFMFYNRKYVSAPPNTTAQLIQVAEQINKTYGVWGVAYGASTEWGYRFAAWFAGFGGQIFVLRNGTPFPDLNSSAMVSALEFWHNMTYVLRVNYLAPSPGTEDSLFTQNKAAIIFDGTWHVRSYFSALGCDLGAAPLPVVNYTGLHAMPFIGSMGWAIATPKASGATQEQVEASLLFVEFMTNYTNEWNLWTYARDIPALQSAYQAALQQLSQPTSNQTQGCLDQVMKGVLEKAQYGQRFPNVPQMQYYWPSFHKYADWYFFYNNVTAQQAAQDMEQYFISQLQANGLLTPSTYRPTPAKAASQLPEAMSKLRGLGVSVGGPEVITLLTVLLSAMVGLARRR
ncbi:MAG: extracellular solute-binding protein [Acidilobus sp.]